MTPLPRYDPQAFGLWVRQRRASLGLQQKELSQAIGLPASALCRIEQGRFSYYAEKVEAWLSRGETVIERARVLRNEACALKAWTREVCMTSARVSADGIPPALGSYKQKTWGTIFSLTDLARRAILAVLARFAIGNS